MELEAGKEESFILLDILFRKPGQPNYEELNLPNPPKIETVPGKKLLRIEDIMEVNPSDDGTQTVIWTYSGSCYTVVADFTTFCEKLVEEGVVIKKV